RMKELVAAALDPSGEGHYAFEYRIVWSDGTVRWVSANGQVRFEGQGADLRPIAFMGTAQDITAQKEAEAVLRELNEVLEQRVAERTIELDRQNQRLRQLANQLSETEQRERSRLAKTLHAGLPHILVAGTMQLALFPNDIAIEVVEQLEKLFDEAIEICHSLTYELSPPVLNSSELPAALEWLARWFETRHRFEVKLQLGTDFPVISEHQKMFLFDAVRELLFNAVKHSGAKAATVTLSRSQLGGPSVSVTDAGQGFDSRKLEQDDEILEGFGLFSIRERLAALDGSMQIDSRPGAGTRCVLSLPPTSEETQSRPA
ncbi:MAG: ATP-binding protein, partial [Salinisphaeraceae bacterium]|nr:ATP-binding protein [Salinisphaeraceae bacterium]